MKNRESALPQQGPGGGFPLVPTLCVGMPSRTLCVLAVRAQRFDAERRRRHSHAERGNEGGSPSPCGGDPRGTLERPLEFPDAYPRSLGDLTAIASQAINVSRIECAARSSGTLEARRLRRLRPQPPRGISGRPRVAGVGAEGRRPQERLPRVVAGSDMNCLRIYKLTPMSGFPHRISPIIAALSQERPPPPPARGSRAGSPPRTLTRWAALRGGWSGSGACPTIS